jgi:hypothetical protein
MLHKSHVNKTFKFDGFDGYFGFDFMDNKFLNIRLDFKQDDKIKVLMHSDYTHTYKCSSDKYNDFYVEEALLASMITFKIIVEVSSEKQEDHTGMVYNPISETWSWL